MIRKKGFTLIEVLLSIVIMAIIAQGTYELMSGVMNSDDSIRKKTERFNEIQKAFNLMERDYTQMVPRATRLSGTSTRSVIDVGESSFGSEGTGLTFTRGGALNPGALLPRGEIVRVWYRLKDENLERGSYPYPDTIIGYEPKYEVILTGVKSFKVFFYNQGVWALGWTDRSKIPLGVKLELQLQDYGKLTRLYYVTAGNLR